MIQEQVPICKIESVMINILWYSRESKKNNHFEEHRVTNTRTKGLHTMVLDGGQHDILVVAELV